MFVDSDVLWFKSFSIPTFWCWLVDAPCTTRTHTEGKKQNTLWDEESLDKLCIGSECCFLACFYMWKGTRLSCAIVAQNTGSDDHGHMNESSHKTMDEWSNNPDWDDNDTKDEEQRLQSQYCVKDWVELVDNGPSCIKNTDKLCSTLNTSLIVSNHTIVQVLSCIDRIWNNVCFIIIIAYSRLTQFSLLNSESLLLLLDLLDLLFCKICSRTGIIGRCLLPFLHCMSDCFIVIYTY